MNLIIVQAREQSERLPNKVLLKVKNKTILELNYLRCLKSNIDKVVIATTENSKKIQKLCIEKNMEYFIGDEQDVLKRYFDCAKKWKANNIIRITSDNACIDYKIINKVLKKHIKENNDFTTNAYLGRETFPEGLEVSIVKFSILTWLYINTSKKIYREHVLNYISDNPDKFKIGILNNKLKEIKYLRLTVDNEEDFILIDFLYKILYNKNNYFGIKEIYKLWLKDKNIFNINQKYKRDYKYYEDKSRNKN